LIKNGEPVDTKQGDEGGHIGGEDYSNMTIDEIDADFKAMCDEMDAIEDEKKEWHWRCLGVSWKQKLREWVFQYQMLQLA
jgi:hypothetical protein